MKQKYILIAILTMTSILAKAQSMLDHTTTWSCVQSIDLLSSTTLPDTFAITINSTVLTITGSDIVKDFDVENIQGAWPSINEAGQLTFDLPVRDFTGKGSIQNEAGVIFLILDFSARTNGLKRKFILTAGQ